MYNKYPSDTTTGRRDLSKLLVEIKQTLVVEEYREVDISTEYGNVTGLDREFRGFTQPVTLRYDDTLYACFNGRQTFGDSRKRDKILNAIKSYLILQWTVEQGRIYRSDYKLSGMVFVRLIANNITRMYNLNPEQTMSISLILADYYNWLLMAGDDPVTEEVRVSGILKFAKTTSQLAEKMAAKEQVYEGVESLGDVIRKAELSPKLRRFNASSLLTVVTGIVYGQNSKEDIAIGLEYPPIWNWLVYRSLSNVSYKNTLLTKTAMVIAKDRSSNAIEYTKLMGDIDTKLSNAIKDN